MVKKIAMHAGIALGVLFSVITMIFAPIAQANYGNFGGCPAGYEVAFHPNPQIGQVCAAPPVVTWNQMVSMVSANIFPPMPGQPLQENVSLDTNLPPCFQVSPRWPCSPPWLFMGM